MGLLSLGRAVGGATQQVSNGIRDAVGDPQCPHRASRVGAVRSDAAVRPVSPESWAMYYVKRFTPGLLERFTGMDNPFAKK